MTSRKKIILFALILLVLGAGLIWYSVRLAEFNAVAELESTARDRLLLYEGTLEAAFDRYRYLPYILAINPEIQRLLQDGGQPFQINAYLEAVNDKAGSAALYVLNERGVTVASSNWKTSYSYVGKDYSFRPYYKDAIAGREGLFYGIGQTTGIPGYFISYPVSVGEEIIGAAVVKVELDLLQRSWRQAGETVFVTDQNGVIILGTRDIWKYRVLTALGHPSPPTIRGQQQYQGAELTILPASVRERLGLTELTIGHERFLLCSQPLAGLGWEIHYLVKAELLEEQGFTVAAIGVAVLLALLLLGMLARVNHLRKISRIRAIEARQVQLINQQLESEVRERRRKERELRETQKELIHAGQMAALGQMAASVAHEINQPLAAIRMYSANCKVLLERGQAEPARENLSVIHDLTGRLASLAQQLKSFSRKSAGRLAEIDLRHSLRNALALVGHQAEAMGCRLETSEPDQPLMVKGNPTHLDQVFVNLVQNSLDAVRDSPQKLVRVDLHREGRQALAVVSDSGPGLSPQAQERLFSPFFTTKEPGHGLGLGLSIIHGIIKEMGGSIQGHNLPGAGACFTVRLDLVNDE
jgi:two-component system C4-dicarboxylate transport sensor histidine kinase DctB